MGSVGEGTTGGTLGCAESGPSSPIGKLLLSSSFALLIKDWTKLIGLTPGSMLTGVITQSG